MHGNGLVYNPGEIVEGYTNFLWTLLAAGGLLLGLAPGGVSLAVTIACSILLLGLTFVLGERLAGIGQERWALLAAGLLAVDAGFVTYGPKGSGLETMAFALFVLLSVAMLWGDGENEYRWWWRALGGLALAVAALTRPEGLMVAAVLLALRAWQDRRAGRGMRTLLMWALGPFLVIVVPYEVWRVWFYGYPVPNTFYAKTGTSVEQIVRGAEYALSFVADHWLVVLASLFGVVFAGVSWLRTRRRDMSQSNAGQSAPGLYWALAALVAAFTLYIVAEGGDWAIGGRFFVPLAAPLALLTQEAVRISWGWFAERPAMRRAASISLAVLVGVYAGFALWLQRPEGELSTRTGARYVQVP